MLGLDVLGDGEVDVLLVLVGHQVLLGEVGCGPHEHHPVTLVLVARLEETDRSVWLLKLMGKY